MKQSLRRVSEALLSVGVVALFGGMLLSFTAQCAAPNTGCMAASTIFGVPDITLENITTGGVVTNHILSTSAVGTGQGTFSLISDVTEQVGAGLIFIAVGVLIVLEVLELHYLRKIVSLRKKTT